MLGKTFAHYEITEHVGTGGMGEVYKARDTKLGRDVALKFLPESFAADTERLQRFEREAKLLAALNHPNIAAIYGIEQTDDTRFLVLELVPGEDLAERISHGPVPLDDALVMALQVAEALESAHDQGVVHRDLKPGNVVVTPESTVKVLDFGLAKALESDKENSGLSHSPTLLASSPTMQGVILGTAGYMSPEQARGKVVDRRADIWAFGCVLKELLTGRQTFSGETVSDTLASVLKTEPDWETLPDETPGAIVRLLRRCLDKDPRQRLRDIGEARIIIERVIRGELDETAQAGPVEAGDARGSGRGRLAWLAGSVVVAAVVGTTAWTLKPDPPEPPLRKFSLAVERDDKGGPDDPVVSPDGSCVVYTVGGRLWVQELDELKPREIAVDGEADKPFWSPDGAFIGYLSSNGNLWKVPVSGGTSVKVCDPQPSFTGGRGATWAGDGRIIYSYGSSGLFEVTDQGGDPHIFHDIDLEKYGDFHEPSLLPGGKGVLYVAHRKNGSADTIELIADGEQKELVQVDGQRLWNPRFSPSGHVVYRRSGANGGIWAVPFSLSKLDVIGEPFLVATDGVDPSIASDGTLVYLRGENDVEHVMKWVGRDGVVGDSVSVPMREYAEPALSPDGNKLAVTEYDGDEIDVWVHDLTRGTRTRFTFDEGEQVQPVWSPDGKQIYYADAGSDSIFVRAADGTGAARAVARGRLPDLSDDGAYMSYHIQGGQSQEDIWYLELDSGSDAKPYLVTPARELGANLSPDGRYIAYMSNESEDWEIYVKRFPGGEGKWQVSTEGGISPLWSADGRTLYYRQDGCDIVEVPVEMEPNLVLGTPRKVVDCSDLNLTSLRFRCYTVSHDGSRFLMLQAIRPDLNTIDIGITVVENWASEFAEKASR